MAGHLLSLYPATRASRLNRLTSNLPLSAIRGYTHGKNGSGGIDQQRAPSTAEEFKRVAEEKTREGLSSQTVEKTMDGAGEAGGCDSKLEQVKEAYKESPGRGDLHNEGDKQ